MLQCSIKNKKNGAKIFFLAVLLLTDFFSFTYYNKVFAAAGVPKILSHQGRLLDSSGNLLGGSGTNYCYLFSVYDGASGGSKLWPSGSSATTTVSVKNGIYAVDIGDTSAGGDALTLGFDNDSYYLNIQVANSIAGSCATVLLSSYETLTPRKRITSAGYAINSGTVGGFTPAQSATGNQLAALTSGNLVLGATNPQLNVTGSNTLTLQGGGGTGNIRFFDGNNYITPGGILNSLGLITTNATTTNLEVTATTTFSGQRMQFPSGAGSNGYVLTTNGSGILSWSANGSGSQTPWAQNVDGGGYNLSNVNKITTVYASSTVMSVASNLYTALNTGSVPFIGSSGLLTEDTTNFFWDNSNNFLGLGTNSPLGKLTIRQDSGNTDVIGETPQVILSNLDPTVGNIRLQSYGAFSAGNGAATTTAYEAGLLTAADTNLFSGSIAWGTLNVGSLAERMRLTNAGRLGIGTTTPGTILSIGNTGDNTINIDNTATSTFGRGINVRTGCFAINGTCVGAGGSGTVTSVDVSGGTTGLTTSGGPITTSGTITLAGTLAIANGGTNNTSAYTAGSVIFSSGTALTQDNASLFFDNNTNRLGIGTTTPPAATPLQVSLNDVTRALGTSLVISDQGATTDLKHWGMNTLNGSFRLGTVNDTLTTVTNRLTVLNGGNLGIGTTTPWGKLSVTQMGTGGDPAFIVEDSASPDTTPFVITQAGDVGIADGNPAYTLEVGGTFGTAGNVTFGDAVGDTVTSNAGAWTFANDTTVALTGGLNGLNFDSDTLSIDATNNRVGIGEAAPDDPFHIKHGAGVSESMKIETTDNASNVVIGMQDSSPGQARFLAFNFLDSGGAADGQVGYQQAAVGASQYLRLNVNGADRLHIDGSGNVGVGDASPDFFFDVEGASAFNGLMTLSGTASNIALGSNFLSGDGGDEGVFVSAAGFVGIGGTTTPSTLFSVGGVAGTATGHGYFTGGMGVGVVNTTAGSLQTSAAATIGTSLTVSGTSGNTLAVDTSTLIVDATNDRVGIGTTTPLHGLSINKKTVAINTTKDGSLDVWQTNANSLPAGTDEHTTVSTNGYIYVLGANGTTANYYTLINSDGSLGTWSSNLSVLPAARSNASSFAANGYVYVIGGSSATTVYYAKVNSDGSLGSWNTNTNVLPAGNSRASAVTANGYVYVIGGDLGNANVYYAKINSDGSIGVWSSASSLPTGSGGSGTFFANGYLYVIGGAETGNCEGTTHVYYAKTNPNGSLDTWTTNANLLPNARGHLSAVSVNGYVYAMGGNNAGCIASQSTVYYARLNSGGSIGVWGTNSNSLPDILSDHTSVVVNGYIYAIGGNNDTVEKTTVYYTSTARTQIAGALDLVGLNSINLSEGGSAGSSLTVGDIIATSNFEVRGNAMLWNGLGVNGAVTIKATTSKSQAISLFSVQNATSTGSLMNVLYNGQVTIPNGSLCVDSDGSCNASTTGRVSALSYTTGATDLAENYSSTEALEPGEIVVSIGGDMVIKTVSSLSRSIGVVSTKPGVILGLENDSNGEGLYPIALAGRVPVKVNLDGGEIRIGDNIVPSNTPGVGMRATTTARSVGVALESFTATSTTDRILIFIENKDHIPASQLFIDRSGNVGINNIEPTYKLHVSGDIAANSFVNLSSREYKNDITYLSKEDENSILDQINKTFVARYSYIKDATSSPLRLGLIAEEAPIEVLSESGKGIDLYKLVTYILAGLKAQQTQIAALAVSVGSGMSDGLTAIRDMVVATFEIGSSNARTGVTVYDLKNGDPFCMAIYDGNNVSIPGKCRVYDGTTLIYEKSSSGNITPSSMNISNSTAPTIIENDLPVVEEPHKDIISTEQESIPSIPDSTEVMPAESASSVEPETVSVEPAL